MRTNEELEIEIEYLRGLISFLQDEFEVRKKSNTKIDTAALVFANRLHSENQHLKTRISALERIQRIREARNEHP